MNDSFTFTVTDLARFLGKAPATIRAWEQQGVIEHLSRSSNGDRKLSALEVSEVAQSAFEMRRIHINRLRLVLATTTMLKLIEEDNDEKIKRRLHTQVKSTQREAKELSNSTKV